MTPTEPGGSLLALAAPPTAPADPAHPVDLPIPGFHPRPFLVTPDMLKGLPAASPGAPSKAEEAPAARKETHLGSLGRFTALGLLGMGAVAGVIGFAMGNATAGQGSPAPTTVSAPALLDGEGNPAPEVDRPAAPAAAAAMPMAAATGAAVVASTRNQAPAEEAPAVLLDEAAPMGVAARRQGTEWKRYQGTFHGETFSFEYPAGWKVTKLYNGFMVSHPQNDKLGAAFYWLNGAGEMSPDGLLQMLANDSGAKDWQTVRQTPDAPGQSPIGPVQGLTTEATYELRGTPSHGKFHSVITVNRGPYASLWYGSMSSQSAPASEWHAQAPVLDRIVDSFNADANAG